MIIYKKISYTNQRLTKTDKYMNKWLRYIQVGYFYKIDITLLLVIYLPLETQIYYNSNYHYPITIQNMPNITILMPNCFPFGQQFFLNLPS